MTREEAKRRAVVMLAWANGEEIQSAGKTAQQWQTIPADADNIYFNWDILDFRIKSKPLEGYAIGFGEGFMRLYITHDEAKRAATNNKCSDIIKVREVEGEGPQPNKTKGKEL